MTAGLSSTATTSAGTGSRAADIRGFKVLKSPSEGGTKKDHEDFLEKIAHHVTITWAGGKDIGQLIKTGKEPDISQPPELTKEQEASKLQNKLWNIRVEKYEARTALLEENRSAMFALIMGGMTKIMKGRVKASVKYAKAESSSNIEWLLEQIEDIVLSFEEVMPKPLALDDQMERIMGMKQTPEMGNEDFIKVMEKELKVFEKHGGRFLWGKEEDSLLKKSVREMKEAYEDAAEATMPDDEVKEARKKIEKQIKEQIAAITILKRACKKRYGGLLKSLSNSFLLGENKYPSTLADVLKILNHYQSEARDKREEDEKNEKKKSSGSKGKREKGVSFLQSTGDPINISYLRGTNGSFYSKITCRLCNTKGHYQTHCPVATNEKGHKMKKDTPSNEEDQEGDTGQDTRQTGQTREEVSRRGAIVLNQTHVQPHINPNWVLLDSESTEHIFRNRDLLTDVEPMTNGETLRLHSSGGYIDTKEKGKFGGFAVWYNPQSLANILSLALVTEEYRVTMDSEVEDAIKVHISSGHTIVFKKGEGRLYYFDTTAVDLHKLRLAFSFLSTVEQNKSVFGAREVRKADETILLGRRTNHMAPDKFMRVIKDNWITNVPFTTGDVRRAQKIYGPPIPPIKGRTRYQESKRIPDAEDIVQIPRELYEDWKDVTLCVDFHYVNGVAVLHTISRKINYRTVSFPMNRSAASIMTHLKRVWKKYNARGFRIVEMHADREFEKVEEKILPIRLRTAGVDEHIPEIERSIQTQKNENRAVSYAMPYKCIPRVMVRELIEQGNAFLNAFGTKDNMAQGLSPRNIIDNLPHIDYNDLKYEFGQYVQLHVTQKFTNTMKSRTIGAIVLGPRDIRGTYNFMSLETGEKIDGRVVAELPITEDVIRRVEQLGEEQNQPVRASRMLQYEWRPGIGIAQDDHEPEQQGEGNEGIIPEPIDQTREVVNDGNVTNQGAETSGQDHDEGASDDPRGQDEGDRNQGAEDEDQGAEDTEQSGKNQGAESKEENEEEDNREEEDSDDSDDEEITLRRESEKRTRKSHFENPDTNQYGRGKRERRQATSFTFLQTTFQDMNEEQRKQCLEHAWKEYKTTGKTNALERYATGHVFAQMSAKKGIKKYRQKAKEKLIAEFKQLLQYETFHGVRAQDLTQKQKSGAGNMINIIEEKINRGHTEKNPILKGRSCFNGRVQRGLYTKEEKASPTIAQDAFFITCIIDALEGRAKTITDVKGAYLNARMKDEVYMRIRGPEVDMFCALDPKLKKFVVTEKNEKTLYVQLDKALYGCVQSALLWYELYSDTLKEMGFKINPYDRCVANAMIDGKQCTVCWYVDDNKISHKDPKVVKKVVTKIEEKFGKMSQTEGDDQEFLGMSIKYTEDGKVKVRMDKHIQKAMDEFEEPITRTAATPANSHLFKTRSSPELSEQKADNFHSVVAMLLYVAQRCRLDIQTAVAYLTTRVANPTEDDWKKLRRVLQYLKGTEALELTLGADDITRSKTWIDASYGVHDDCRSHTGGGMSWGWGMLLNKCQKQKLNTKSSTETEVVGVSDFLPNMIWARMFLKEQGYDLKENILYQDNESAIKLEKNGRASSGRKTKHIDNRYFWIKDRITTEGITIEHCPTERMVADFYTKPLQGNLFRVFRDVILGYAHVSSLNDIGMETSDEERVGRNEKRGEKRRKCEEFKTVITSDDPNPNGNEKKVISWADIVSHTNKG